MKRIESHTPYFSGGELALWGSSVLLIVAAYAVFDRASPLTLVASLVGVTSLILNAKGNPIGQLLMLLFSLLYGVISYSFAYYGEMITYLGMTAPMALFSLISWLRHPFRGSRAEVTVARLQKKEYLPLLLMTGAVTAAFYVILGAFHTANLLPSTLSVSTSFFAAYLTFRRSAWFALAYAVNDIVLIVLWSMAALTDVSYLSVVVCFVIFLVNDLYGFWSWLRMRKNQAADEQDRS